MLHNNAFMANLRRRQQRESYVTVFERNYVPANLHSFNTLHINAALQQKHVRLLAALFRRTVWLNMS